MDTRFPNKLVVNFFGGPGTGKSTAALLTSGSLKKRGVETELADEWIKEELYGRNYYAYEDQGYTFANQKKRLDSRLLGLGTKVVVTDSPILLSAVYMKKPRDTYAFEQYVIAEFKRYNNLNFFMLRDIPYSSVGRREDPKSAASVDDAVYNLLNALGIPYQILRSTEAAERAPLITIKRLKDMGLL